MEVKDMFKKPKFSKLNKMLESRYDYKFNTDSLTVSRAQNMLSLVENKIKAVQQSHSVHLSEQNAAYCELLLMRESLATWIGERTLTEGEVAEAEVILAAKNVTDAVQKMVEQAGKIINEQLPALITAIRDQIGVQQADAYKNTVGQTLTELLTQLGTARDQLDNGVMTLTGQAVDTDMSMPAPVGDETDMPDDMPAGDDFAATDAETGGTEPLGRERR